MQPPSSFIRSWSCIQVRAIVTQLNKFLLQTCARLCENVTRPQFFMLYGTEARIIYEGTSVPPIQYEVPFSHLLVRQFSSRWWQRDRHYIFNWHGMYHLSCNLVCKMVSLSCFYDPLRRTLSLIGNAMNKLNKNVCNMIMQNLGHISLQSVIKLQLWKSVKQPWLQSKWIHRSWQTKRAFQSFGLHSQQVEEGAIEQKACPWWAP